MDSFRIPVNIANKDFTPVQKKLNRSYVLFFITRKIIQMECEEETTFNVENPLHLDNIPVANAVVIEVEGHPILDLKQEQDCVRCEKLWDYVQMAGAIVMLIGMLCGFILLLIWFFNPFVFGPKNADD